MAVDATTAPIPTSDITTNNSSGSSSTSGSSTGIADNFQSFLMLLTTQLQNQNPMDPLDTNQFTQQLVQFAQVEQQLKSNSQLEALVKIEKTAQSTQALVFVGQTVAVDGSTAHFDGNATWNFSAPSNSSATITITNSAGQTAYTGSFAIGSGNSSFVWDGKGADGTKWPAGDYKMTVTAKDSNDKDVAISTEVQGTVDSVDLTASPALLSIGGKNYTLEQIKRVVRPPASS
ncbi:flagellar biosynthesis protein FlgD [Afipia massiliensis]|uniref:Basal-body rod modification protein FlgD n=1 Tax=Afipia massiliensis TaxID=211460 RepID=A0A4U6BNH3_9BRAD|nr:flagellar hook capping FlgD N-terminal domain-containing protein [Afipia massiliensis]TKT70528.1 flagellar biosynthesis protein FlgD [Afipia massiliensis]